MTTTADGCLRLFAAGARRPAAQRRRGPRLSGVAAVAAVGVEAFVAAAGGGGYVARAYDLASGRELGALLAVPADDSGSAEYSRARVRGGGRQAPGVRRRRRAGLGAGGRRGRGGGVHLWDSRVAPRGGRRGSTAAGAGSAALVSAGVAPVMTLRVPGASSVSSVSTRRRRRDAGGDGLHRRARLRPARAGVGPAARAWRARNPARGGRARLTSARRSSPSAPRAMSSRGRARARLGTPRLRARARAGTPRASSSPERRRIDRRGGSRRGSLFVPQARVRVRARALPL